jgi:predicted nucleic acid-binding protein
LRFTRYKDTARLTGAQQELGLGIGEVSAILLAIELDAEAVLMDDRDGRRAAWKMGVDTVGSVGVLEEGFRVKADSRFARRLSAVVPIRRFHQSKDSGAESEKFQLAAFVARRAHRSVVQ